MNRENKLAIIIGFSLVLVVAVLISDHFSRARTVQIGSDIKPGTSADFGAGPPGLTRALGGPESIPVHTNPLGEVEPRVRNVSDNAGATPGSDGNAHDDIVMGPDRGGASKMTPSGDDADGVNEMVDPNANFSAVPPRPYSTGEMRSHEIKDGDKLFRIAAKYYGDGTLWKTLADYNRKKLPDPSNLRLGITLDIPPKDVLLGEAVMPPAGMKPKSEPATKANTGGRPKGEKPVPADRNVAKNEKPKDEKAKKSVFDTYKIARGDDLSTIAQKLLGSSKRARELYQLNKDVIEDEHTLIAGTVIKVPAR